MRQSLEAWCRQNKVFDILEEWDYEKNRDLIPSNTTPNSHLKVYWKCSNGHFYNAAIANRTRGAGCPYCSGRMVLKGYNDLCTVHPDIAAEWDYELNGDLRPEQFTKGSGVAVWWKCSDGHQYKSTINARSRGGKCPYCSHQKLLIGKRDLATLYPEIAKEWNYEKNTGITPSTIAAQSNKRVWWKCALGHEWITAVANRSTANGKCPYCSGKKVWCGFNDLRTLYPDIAAEWDYELNGELSPEQFTKGSSKTVWWKCKEGHSWKSQISNRTNGHKCPFCSHQRVLSGQNDLETLYPEIAAQWDYSKNGDVLPSEVFPQVRLSYWFKCPLGHSYKQSLNHKIGRNQLCPVCSREVKTSFPEQAILFYLKKQFSDVVSGDRRFGFELDIYIPSVKTAIEYDGVFWHQNNHTTITEQIKNARCREEGIRLIRVREKGLKGLTSGQETIVRADYNTDASLNDAINDLLKLLCVRDVDVNVERDKIDIYNNYIILRKENSIEKTHPELVKEWNYERNKGLKPDMFVANSNKEVWWKCDNGHEWNAKIQHRTRRKDGCPICGNRTVLAGENDLFTSCPELKKEWDYNKNTIDPLQLSAGSAKRVWWICTKGHSYSRPVRERTGKKRSLGCPICQNYKRSREVVCVETGKIFENSSVAAHYLGGDSHISTYIYDCCTGKRNTSCGFHWRFVEENDNEQ